MAEQWSETEDGEDEFDTPLDAFCGHEVLHVASVASDFFDRHLLQHRYVKAHPELSVEAERISEALADFYQLCGRVTLEGSPSPEAGVGGA